MRLPEILCNYFATDNKKESTSMAQSKAELRAIRQEKRILAERQGKGGPVVVLFASFVLPSFRLVEYKCDHYSNLMRNIKAKKRI